MDCIIIRADHRREKYIHYLKEYLPNAEYVYDKKQNAMDTFLRALLAAGDRSCLHMEDDIILTKNFEDKIHAVIQQSPDNVFQFFSMRKKDIEVGSRWETPSNFISALCFYLPKTLSEKIYNFYDEWQDKDIHPTGVDLLVRDYLKKNKIKYYIHVPSLVNHRVGVSLIDKRRSCNRVAKVFEDGLYE